MILVDSSVWIDYFRGKSTAESDRLESLLGREPLLAGDLILVEVLQGFRSEREFNTATRIFSSMEVIDLAGAEIWLRAARNFRALRSLGITVRKTMDTIIATRCIERRIHLLYSDRDFDPFVRHLGLRSAMAGA